MTETQETGNVIASKSVSYGRKFKSLRKSLAVSIINQAVSSGTNFCIGLYLVRTLAPVEFGEYGVCFAISLFCCGFCNALFLSQMVVIIPDKKIDDRPKYAASILTSIMIFCLILVVFSLIILVIGKSWLGKYSALVLPIAFSSVAFVLKDFFVRYSYTARNEVYALQVNTTVLIFILSLFGLQYLLEDQLTVVRALWYYATSNFSGAVAGYILLKLPMTTVRKSRLTEDVRDAWRGGRWAAGTSSVVWMQSQAYTYVTALFLGPVGVGFANAARMLITPFWILLPAIDQVAIPRLAELRLAGKPRVTRTELFITLTSLLMAATYVAVIIFAADFFIPLFVGNNFQNLYPLIFAWSTVMFFCLISAGAVRVLQVMKDFRSLLIASTISAVTSIAFAIYFIELYGVPGAVFGTGVGELIFGLILWYVILRMK